jgi:hypothetical protein
MTNEVQYQILIWSIVMMAAGSLGLLGVIKARRPLLYPGLLVFMFYLMGYGLPALKFGLLGSPQTGMYQWPYLPSALAFESLFLLLLWFGFFYGAEFLAIFRQEKPIPVKKPSEWSLHPFVEKLPLLMSITAFIVFLTTNYYAGGTLFKGGSIWESGLYNTHVQEDTQIGILTTAALFYPAIFLAGMLWARNKKSILFLCPGLLILYIVSSSTSRGAMLPLAYFFAAAYLAAPQQLKVQKNLIFAGLLVIVGLVMMMAVREGGWENIFTPFTNLHYGPKVFQERTGSDSLSSLSYAFYFRDHGYGQMGFFKWLFSMVPLPSLWGIGWTTAYAYSVDFGSILNRGIGASGWPCPAQGEFYLQMGWPGALLGIPLGMGMAYLWRTLELEKTTKPSPLMILLYTSTIQGLITSFHSPSRSCTRIFLYCVFLWAILRTFKLVNPLSPRGLKNTGDEQKNNIVFKRSKMNFPLIR